MNKIIYILTEKIYGENRLIKLILNLIILIVTIKTIKLINRNFKINDL